MIQNFEQISEADFEHPGRIFNSFLIAVSMGIIGTLIKVLSPQRIRQLPQPAETSSAMPGIRVLRDSGQGRPFILLYESGIYQALAERLCNALATRTRSILIETDEINDRVWSTLTERLGAVLGELGLRQASFVTFGAAGTILQCLALADMRAVRTAILIDASTRPHPGWFLRILDRIERFMPMGLPFRSTDKGFDGRSALQRMRFPTLVVNSPLATPYLKSQGSVLLNGLPTAWYGELVPGDYVNELTALAMNFEQVPAKRPQKSVRGN